MPERDIGAEQRARAREIAREIGAGPEEVDTVAALFELGVRPAAMRHALERGRLADAIFDAVLDPERDARTVSPRDIEARGGMPAIEVALLMQSAGLPAPGPDEPTFTEHEAEVFVEVGRLREVWTPELSLQVARVSGRALARIAHTQVQAFRLHVEPRLRAESRDSVAALTEVHWAFERLLPLAAPFLAALHRRLFERELADLAVREAESRAGATALPGAVDVSILFCDLKDFTAYANQQGDDAAVEAIEHFARIVTAECRPGGRIVKGLGDGYMLAFPEPGAAVRTGWEVIERHRESTGPGVHASLHHGVAVARDGDYFGTVVNVAARILAAARRDQLIATSTVAKATAAEFSWEDAGASYLRGVRGTVELCRLAGPRARAC